MEVKDKKNSVSLLSEKYLSLVSEFKDQLKIGKLDVEVSHSQGVISMGNTHYHSCKQNLSEEFKASNEDIIQAFIKTISKFIGQDDVEVTLQGLNVSIKKASEFLFVAISQQHLISEGRSTITLKAISEIIIHLINKHISKNLSENFNSIKNSIVKLCDDLLQICEGSKKKISRFFINAMRTGMTIMVHGFSTTVYHAIVDCKNSGINLNVLITDCSPEHSGLRMKKALTEQGVKSHIIVDLSVGYHMKDVDCVVVGSNALVENGGLINRIGTYTLAICAKSFKKPFYVLSECLKFLKLYPLEQGDIPYNSRIPILENEKKTTSCESQDNTELFGDFICDYTPPEFINLLFTDLGIFTPSAISDELIQMFYN